LYLALGTVGVCVACVLAYLFPVLFDVPPELRTEARVAVVLLGVYQGAAFGLVVFTASLLGTGRMYLVNFSGFAVSFLVSISQVALLLLGGGLPALAAVQIAGAVVSIVVFRSQVRRAMPDVELGREFDRPTAKRLLSLGWRNSVLSFTGVLAFGSDIVLVGLLVDAKAAAAYAIALRVYTLVQRVATGVLGAIGPSHAHAAQNASPEHRFQIYCAATFLTLCLASCGALAVGTFAGPLLDLWLGDVPQDAATILGLLCVVLVLQAPGMNAASFLLSSERPGDMIRLSLIAAGINVLASVALTVAFGAVGPALGSLLAVGLIDAIFLPRLVCRLLGQPYRAFVRQAVWPLLLPAGVMSMLLLAGHQVVSSGPLVLLAVSIAMGAFGGLLWSMPAGRDMRARIRRPPGVGSYSSGTERDP